MSRGEYSVDSDNMSEGKVSVALLVLVAAVIIANLAITAVLLARDISNDGGMADGKEGSETPPAGQGGQQQQPSPVVVNVGVPAVGGGAGGGGSVQGGGGGGEQRTHIIAVDRVYQAFSYLNEDGMLKGFHMDLIEKVCEAAGMMCEAIPDKKMNCLESVDGGWVLGPGIQNQYYEACIGWAPTVQRLQVGKFALPFIEGEKAYFFYNKSGSFDPSSFMNKRIGFISTYANNEQCLSRKMKGTPGIPLESTEAVMLPDNQALFDAIYSGEVNAGFAAEGDMSMFLADGKVEYQKSSEMSCVMGGDSVMTRKDSRFTDLWDAGFSTILRNGVFNKLCKDAVSKHGSKGEIPCVDSFDV